MLAFWLYPIAVVQRTCKAMCVHTVYMCCHNFVDFFPGMFAVFFVLFLVLVLGGRKASTRVFHKHSFILFIYLVFCAKRPVCKQHFSDEPTKYYLYINKYKLCTSTMVKGRNTARIHTHTPISTASI